MVQPDELKRLIREVPDFPKPGILFYDITTLLKDARGFQQAVEALASQLDADAFDLLAGVEARGFIFAGALAYRFGKGLVPVRKPGKLPAATVREEYALEYGTDAVEIHQDAIQPGTRVVIVDDVLATGGTARATARLIERAGGKVAGIVFLIELDFLRGRENLAGYPVHSILHYSA